MRVDRDLQQQDLAHRAGISAAYLSQIETGKKEPSMEVLGRLAEALEVTSAQLLAEPPRPSPPAQDVPPEPREPGGDRPLPRIKSRDDVERALRSRLAIQSLVTEAHHALESGLRGRLGQWATVAEDFTRLLHAFADDAYRAIPWDALVLVAAAVAYVSESEDVVPDHLERGHVDDMAVLAFTESLTRSDLHDFREWERTRRW